VELLDFAGPGEVFQAANGPGASRARPAFRAYTVAASTAPLTSQTFVKIVPDTTWDDAPKPDLIVIPGGNSGSVTGDPKFMAWLSKNSPSAEVTMTVCTGAFALAKTGRLDGVDATTWYGAIEALKTAAPKTHVVDGRRFVDNDAVITTAGVSAGIDGALHTVARLLGRAVADGNARYMDYRWTPEPYLAPGYTYLNPSLDERGRRAQQAGLYEEEKSFDQAEKAYRALVAEDPADGASWYHLGAVLHASGRYEDSIEASRRVAGFADLRASALYNVACAYARLGRTDDAIGSLEQAVAAGYKAKWAMTRDADLASVRDDARFKSLFASM
jgi:putative intracellular protease/amidase